jgi:hypothetical protein
MSPVEDYYRVIVFMSFIDNFINLLTTRFLNHKSLFDSLAFDLSMLKLKPVLNIMFREYFIGFEFLFSSSFTDVKRLSFKN